VFNHARQWLTDVEMVGLTMIVAATNAWNRVDIGLWHEPEAADPADTALNDAEDA
jgi:alkylhydroperoxidase family enzyme